jgi:DNA-directed RNA polymerase specialized sigma subunit
MRISSLNQTLTDGETPLEVLVPSREDDPIDRLAYLELQTEINTLLQEAIAQIDPSLLSILELYYKDRLSQAEIAEQLNINQSTISRKLKAFKEKLIEKLLIWAEKRQNISCQKEVIKVMNELINEWLKQHFAEI